MPSSSSIPQNPSSHNVAALLPKLQDADSDIRYMTLNDLHEMLSVGSPTFLAHDQPTSVKIAEGILRTLADTHGDVQNMAIKCLGPFVNKASESVLGVTIERISSMKTDNVDASIPALSLRTIVSALPHPVVGVPRTAKAQEACVVISRVLIPRLVGKSVVSAPRATATTTQRGMLQRDLETGIDSNTLDLLAEVARCFGPVLQPAEVQVLEDFALAFFESDRCGSVIKKKAVAAITALSPFFDDALLSQYVTSTIEKLRSPHLLSQQRKLYITVYGSLARSIPQKFGPYLQTLAPFVLAPLSQMELKQQRDDEAENDGERDLALEEVREAALVAIEAFLQYCPECIKPFRDEVAAATLRFLKHEPNVAEDMDEDMDEEIEPEDDYELDEDFEEETGFDDEDDASWKVRRCSAKALHAVVGSLPPDDLTLYNSIAPALIARFTESEESVRTEVISTLGYLVARSSSGPSNVVAPERHIIEPSRKRRRGLSDSISGELHFRQVYANGYDSPSTMSTSDDRAQNLAQIGPEVVKASTKQLKGSSLPTKQAILTLLKDLVIAQQGRLASHVEQIVDPVVESLNSGNAGATSMATNNLRVEALALLKAVFDAHSSKVIQPFLSNLVPALVIAAKDRFAKVASEAFVTIESLIKALSPPRSASSNPENGQYLTELFHIISDRISASDTDTDVRQKAVQALGLLIGRTSGAPGDKLLSQQHRYDGQQLILERLKNELTRLPCIRALDTIAILAQSPEDFRPGFVGAVTLELGAQLRKSSRSLRGASLSALRMIAVNRAARESLDDEVVSQLVQALVPALGTNDLHMMSPALVVLAAVAEDYPQLVTSAPVLDAVCAVVTSSLSAAALDALITFVEAVGKSGSGGPLMSALLKAGETGDTDVTGQVIGTLLVSGGNTVGVDLDAFVKELQTRREEGKKCLALSVLGEAGLRLGPQSPLSPESFTPYFQDASEKVQLAAAVALGRAGSGNVKVFLPLILEALNEGKQYLLLHSVKELLEHSNAEDDIKPYTSTLWQNIVAFGQAEDNKAIGAEVLGRLAIIDPTVYLPQLSDYLSNESPTIRGMVMSALRYVFSETTTAYDINLHGSIVPMLETMLADQSPENQRLSLSTFNSALHNKGDIVLPYLQQLLPYAMRATVPKPELIREVQMGPFKHKVDDGLDIRKSAYETLYTLLESTASRQRLDWPAYYDRIVAGLADEHEIKILCCLVLHKLFVLAPQESVRHTDTLVQQFRAILAFKPKDTAVKQELEKLNEQTKAIVKVSVAFNKAGIPGLEENRTWTEYYDSVRRDFSALAKGAEDELKQGVNDRFGRGYSTGVLSAILVV